MIRLPDFPTRRVDRNMPIPFRFVGRERVGIQGDTVASALWGAGVRVFDRSFEYHRPRGLYDIEGEGASQLLSVDGVPNQSAGTRLLEPGMSVRSQNVRGDPRRDSYGILDRFDRLMPAGFYYHRFHRPSRLWPFFQNRMRALAGLGRLDLGAEYDDTGRTEHFLNADVAVAGGGAAGMSAALAAADLGLRVCLFERRPHLGGHLDWRVREQDGRPLYERALELAERISAHERIRTFTHAPVTGIWGENLLTGFEVGSSARGFDERHWECRARAIVVATGAIERPLVFNDNDRPGVMQADTAWRLTRTYLVAPGRRVVFSTADDLGLEAAADLARIGIEIAAVADARREGHDPELLDALTDLGVEVLRGWAAARTVGRLAVRGVEVGSLAGGATRDFRCDLVVASAGRTPDFGVLSTAGARFGYSETAHTFLPRELPARVFAAGRLTGRTDVESIEASGRVAGLEAGEACGAEVGGSLGEARERAASLPGPAAGCGVLFGPGLGDGRKAFLDFDEDGTWKNAGQSAAQGFDVPELAKRFGNFGLGPGQYRVPGQNLAMAMGQLRGAPPEDTACTTVRPPVVPPTLATLAGPGHDVYKRTPLHDEQAAAGGIFRSAGAWQRARYFSDDVSCREEIRNVRTNVGMLDSSPLGKFRLFGPDAVKALQRVYISNMTRMKSGRCKYSAMCNDTGNIVDDGVVVPVGDGDFYVTSSSNRAGMTVEWFRYHTRYDGWDYHLVNLTDALASINIAGPNARAVLERVTDADVSNEAFPYLGHREIRVGDGVPARCLRLGFVGELSYELHVPASYGPYVWALLSSAGEPFGIRPFGQEAQYCLRAEKGHVIIGAESEQRVTLLDIGMGWLWDREDMASRKVGAPALRACADQEGRLGLIGFRSESAATPPKDGALIVEGDEIIGHVCTARTSETLGWAYGLALIRKEYADAGGRRVAFENLGDGERRTSITLMAPHFYDPEGKRLRA